MTAPPPGQRHFGLSQLCIFLLPFFAAIQWVGESNSNSYGITEYFLTYRHGFLKRALVGQLLTRIGFLSAVRIHRVELAAVLLAVAVSYAVFWPALRSGGEKSLWAVLFLCSPACLPHLSFLAAHPDILLFIMLLLAFACLSRLPAAWSPIAALVPCIVGLLIHESFPLMFYPAILVIFWDGLRIGKFRLTPIVIHFLCFSVAFLLILHFGKSHVSSAQLYAEAQARTDIPLQSGIFPVLGNTYAEQWRTLKLNYTPNYFAGVLVGLPIMLPLLIGYTAVVVKVNGVRRKPLPLAGILAVVLLPLGLCLLGSDVFRWLAGSVICLLLFLMYLVETGEPEVEARSPALMHPLGLSLLLYGLAVGPLGGGTVRAVFRSVLMLTRG